MFGDRCFKSHAPITEAERKKLRSQSRSTSPDSPRSKGGGKGKGKGKGKGTGGPSDRGPSSGPAYCRFFLKGECKNGDNCLFPHLNQEAADEINRAKGLAKAKAKAAAKPKAKAAAAIPRVTTLRPALVMPAPYFNDPEGWKPVLRRSRCSR